MTALTREELPAAGIQSYSTYNSGRQWIANGDDCSNPERLKSSLFARLSRTSSMREGNDTEIPADERGTCFSIRRRWFVRFWIPVKLCVPCQPLLRPVSCPVVFARLSLISHGSHLAPLFPRNLPRHLEESKVQDSCQAVNHSPKVLASWRSCSSSWIRGHFLEVDPQLSVLLLLGIH
ncbi:uncharacterized protein BJX67DRAFT_158540 [Aspergillus lucknowensis]|uniref:Uncharacterized protein n=1 Tax=Aspergillus lucknowensis TaxID=176173 RepID=A0ABR4M3Y7_9EURO